MRSLFYHYIAEGKKTKICIRFERFYCKKDAKKLGVKLHFFLYLGEKWYIMKKVSFKKERK